MLSGHPAHIYVYIFCNYSVNASVGGCLSLMLDIKVAFVIRFLTDVVFTSQFD